jgi:hypothetical protein
MEMGLGIMFTGLSLLGNGWICAMKAFIYDRNYTMNAVVRFIDYGC